MLGSDLCPSHTPTVMNVNLDTGCGNENELFLWSSCDLQPMKLDSRTKDKKAIKNRLSSDSISKQEAVAALPGRFWSCAAVLNPPRFEVDQVQELSRRLRVLSSWGRAGKTLTDLCWQMGIQGFISHAVVSCFAVCCDEKKEKSCLSVGEEGF